MAAGEVCEDPDELRFPGQVCEGPDELRFPGQVCEGPDELRFPGQVCEGPDELRFPEQSSPMNMGWISSYRRLTTFIYLMLSNPGLLG